MIERYLENLKDTEYYTLPDDSRKPNWLAIPLQCSDRLELVKYLEENDVQTRSHLLVISRDTRRSESISKNLKTQIR